MASSDSEEHGDELDAHISRTRNELSWLMQRVDEGEDRTVVTEALAALNTALEELEVSSEELRAQNEELAAAQQELARQRKRYRELFALAPEPYLVTDIHGIILEANRQAELLLKRPADRLVGKPIVVFVPEGDRATFRARLRAMGVMEVRGMQLSLRVDAEQTVVVVATVQAGAPYDGETELRWILSSSEPLNLIRQDLNRLLDEARDDVDKLETVRDWQSTLLGAAAHDLRTPLAVVSASLETLLIHGSELGEDRTESLIEHAFAQASRLRRVLTGLLEIARLELATGRFNRSVVSLESVVQRLRDSLDFGAHGFVADVEGVFAYSEGVLLERVLENLIRNAITHTPARSTIWVRTVLEGDDLTLIVEDDGPGVADEVKDDIFLPFVHVQNNEHGGDGSGLGLAIVAMFAAFHGGNAWVEDRPGGGASFHVHMPGAVLDGPQEA